MMTATDNDDMNDLSEHFSFIDDDRSVSSLLPALSFQDSGGGGDDDEMNQIALQLSEEGGVHVSSFESGYSSDQDVAKVSSILCVSGFWFLLPSPFHCIYFLTLLISSSLWLYKISSWTILMVVTISRVEIRSMISQR